MDDVVEVVEGFLHFFRIFSGPSECAQVFGALIVTGDQNGKAWAVG